MKRQPTGHVKKKCAKEQLTIFTTLTRAIFGQIYFDDTSHYDFQINGNLRRSAVAWKSDIYIVVMTLENEMVVYLQLYLVSNAIELLLDDFADGSCDVMDALIVYL